MKYRTALLLAIVMLPVGSVLAADGAIPIWEPTTITEAGNYIVTRNITNGDSVIVITAAGVDIDLNGFTLSGDNIIRANDVQEVSIHDGTLLPGDDDAVEFITVDGFTIRNVLVSGGDQGFRISSCSNGLIADNVLRGNTGILGGGTGLEIRGNVLDGDGIDLVCDGCRIFSNVVSRSGFVGIALSGDNNQVRDNTVTGSAWWGLILEPNSLGTVYRGNTVRGNNGTGCTGTASGGDFCDEGTNNTSHGDNYMPGQM